MKVYIIIIYIYIYILKASIREQNIDTVEYATLHAHVHRTKAYMAATCVTIMSRPFRLEICDLVKECSLRKARQLQNLPLIGII